jgi:Leucine-rich repeat (LRR) protein
VDLKALSDCSNLKVLILSDNKLKAVNLSSLSNAISLEKLILSNNNLKEINLSPLANLIHLQDLDFSGNAIESIDISPLESCTGIRMLKLNGNPTSAIDLWALTNLALITVLDLKNTRLESLDISPLYTCDSLEEVNLDASTNLICDSLFRYYDIPEWLTEDKALDIQWRSYEMLSSEIGWKATLGHIQRIFSFVDDKNHYQSQKGLLDGFGLRELGGYDGNPSELLKLIKGAEDYNEARELLIEGVVKLLEVQFKASGSTLFLDVEDLSQSRASQLIHGIYDLREKEMIETYIPVVKGIADLRYLWVTSYGFSILTAMGIREVRMNLRMLRNIQAAMERIDVTLRLEEEPQKLDPPNVWTKTSESLKDYVFAKYAEVSRWRG